MKYRYSYLEDEKYARIDPIDICIDKIKFGYCITGVKGNAERARLVPAWYVCIGSLQRKTVKEPRPSWF